MRNLKSKILISYIFLLFGSSACYFEESKSSMPLPYEEFSINPLNILNDISNDEGDIFVPIENPISNNEYVLINWSQEDYLTIANSIHKFSWNEELSNWKINSMLFYLQCEEASHGSQSVYLTYFKLVKNDVEEYRLVHNIVIQPQERRIGAWAEKYTQLTSNWEEYNITEFKITSDEALKIAEDNGGKLFRENNNDCSISISLNRRYHNDKDWIVSYDSNFEFIIDTNTGNIK